MRCVGMASKMPAVVMRRKFDRVYVCRKCKAKIRTDVQKVLTGKARCKKCHSRYLRPKKKEMRRK